ncbi:MAG: L,D-transpeptidase [Aestuariivirgaceae bacterium]
MVPTVPVLADTRSVRYNFTSSFGQKLRKSAKRGYTGKKTVSYSTREVPGTIVINTRQRALYLVLKNGKAIRYGVGVGRQGFSWKGAAHIRRKAKWPSWHPPEEMRQRELKQNGRELPKMMPGGPNNPLGARALYLFQGNKDTLYRIHGTNNPGSIGFAQSSGCIRLLNSEIVDLYRRVRIGAKVVVA